MGSNRSGVFFFFFFFFFFFLERFPKTVSANESDGFIDVLGCASDASVRPHCCGQAHFLFSSQAPQRALSARSMKRATDVVHESETWRTQVKNATM